MIFVKRFWILGLLLPVILLSSCEKDLTVTDPPTVTFEEEFIYKKNASVIDTIYFTLGNFDVGSDFDRIAVEKVVLDCRSSWDPCTHSNFDIISYTSSYVIIEHHSVSTSSGLTVKVWDGANYRSSTI